MPAPPEIIKLVERFREFRDDYTHGSYNEAMLRQDFLDPFLQALGWDVDNTKGYAEAYREVIHEDSIRVEQSAKAPDYCLRIGGQRKFFLEAKKPSVNIKDSPHPAYQLRRYAWSAKLPLSVLTDFEELAVYDCRVKPKPDDRASTARVMYLTCDEYEARWDELAGLFSPASIHRGSFDRYAESNRQKRGTAEVDAAFLEEIETWRELLAKNINSRNERLSDRQLNYAVQITIDRLIFLRMCEGRGIEHYGQLQALLNGQSVYGRLKEIFQRADEKYNSGLFHFTGEKGREPPDDLTLGLQVDDKPLKEIIRRLYYPESPYEFAVLPGEILGQVYEQFLGKVIVRSGRGVKVEPKPEVRKAGGVYYTPSYIVDYIVANTVGELLKDRTPKQADKLRILDPACGSGSFLIVAYQKLLDWYLDEYSADPTKHKKLIDERRPGQWRLTTAERKRILLNSIYGVDIDPQAVEVTKLSLLLKVLEGETQESLDRQFRLFHKERALPDLDNNIKCGNSLIGPDFYDDPQMSFLDDEERLRINVFDWRAEFPEIFRGDYSGFDVVLGNPPYQNAVEELTRFSESCAEYVRAKYASARGAFDSSVIFQESGLRLVRPEGKTSLIVPNKFLSAPFGKAFRDYAAQEGTLQLLADYSQVNVFKGVGVYPVVYVLEKRNGRRDPPPVRVERFERSSHEPVLVESGEVLADLPRLTTWSQLFSTGDSLLERLKSHPKLGDLYEVAASATADEAYRFKPCLLDGEAVGDDFLFVTSGAIDRYHHTHGDKKIRYLKSDFTAPFLPRNASELSDTRRRQYASEKIIIAGMTKRLEAIWDDGKIAASVPTVQVLSKTATTPDLKYILAILNSKLIDWVFRQYFSSLSLAGGYLRIGVPQIRELPIRQIRSGDPVDCKRQRDLAALVDRIVGLHCRAARMSLSHERQAIERQIAAADAQIDAVVFQLYALTPQDIASIEKDY